jgi:hypothetical protein
MLIVDGELAERIDENRGDLSRSEFISFLIDSHLEKEVKTQNGVSREEFLQFEQGIKEMLRSFLDFFISYGLELGKEPKDKEIEKLSRSLQSLGGSTTGKSS